jgi:hypothetical protein
MAKPWLRAYALSRGRRFLLCSDCPATVSVWPEIALALARP